MEKYAILLGYFEKQWKVIDRIKTDVLSIDFSRWENGYIFAFKTQQLFTSLEYLFKQMVTAFENHAEDLSNRELLVRMTLEIPGIRPAILTNEAFLLLDKLRTFRHFIRHAYDSELDEKQLIIIQTRLRESFHLVSKNLIVFHEYIRSLSSIA